MISSIIDIFKQSAIEIQALLNGTSATYLQSTNSSGDMQLEVDVQADQLLQNALLELPCVRGICSEEQEDVLYSSYEDAPYLIAYDPLDGSSLVDSNLSIGTIFGIYDGEFEAKKLIASGYILYGPRLEFVLAQSEVLHYRYNGAIWKELGALFVSNKGKINAPGGTQRNWETKHKALVESLFAQGYRLRYSGGMVPDLHQILVKGGGLFSYPATSDAPEGKLRKLFEVFPFAFIYEKAGGMASNGVQRLLDLPLARIHDTSPCFFGSTYEMNLVAEVYGGESNE